MLAVYLRLKTWLTSERGQDLIEYALIAGLIAVVCFLAIRLAGSSVSTLWSAIASAVSVAAS